MSRVEHVEVIHLMAPIPADRTFSTPGGPVDARLTTLVRLTTDDGLVGIGSAYAEPAMVEAAVAHLAPWVLGSEVSSPSRVWNRLVGVGWWFNRGGPATTAIGGIDQAMWDLAGQAAGQPVWRMLGGSRSAVPAYASGMLYSSPEQVAADAAACIERGFTRVKLRIGWTRAYDEAVLHAVRDAIGPDHDLMADGTHRYTLDQAVATLPLLAEVGAFWFEEPLEVADLDGFVELRRAAREHGVPIATGENETSYHGFRELVRAGAVDIAQCDAARCGGITEVARIGALAADHGVQVAPHSWCDPVAIVANAHAVAALGNGLTVEVDQTHNRFIADLLVDRLTVAGGMLELGERPGLGITLDDAVVDELRISADAIPDGNYCDLVYGRGQLRYIGDYAPGS